MLKKSFVLFLSYSLFLSSANPLFAKRKKNRRTALGRSFRESSSNTPKTTENNVAETPAPTPIPAVAPATVPATADMNIKPDETMEKIDTLNAKTMSLQGGQKEIMKRQGEMSKQLEAVNKQAVAATEAANLVLKNADEQKKREFAKKLKEINTALSELNGKVDGAKSACSGISNALNTIYGLDVATTAVSAVGTAAAGGALAVGLIKNNDKMMGKKEPEGVGMGGAVDNTAFEKKKKAMGHARTGLMAASIATSGTSLGTSAAASVNAGKVAEKMKQCNTFVGEIRALSGKVKALIADYQEETGSAFTGNKAGVVAADNIGNACKGFDIAGINAIKNSMTASAVISGIGTATAITGTTTSAIANSGKVEQGSDKQKKLDLTSNIMAGITTGTSLTTTAVSGAVLNKAKKLAEIAASCERSF